MPGFFDADGIAELKRTADIVSIIGDYLRLARAGRRYKGLCPFHDDHNPSLTVDPDRQSFKCWSCGAGGDVITFVQRRERVEFPEAVQIIARKVGMELKPARGAATGNATQEKLPLYEIVEWACAQYESALSQAPEAHGARQYLKDRGFQAESVRRFRLGYAPAGWDWLLRQARSSPYSPEQLEKAGLVVARSSGAGHYDRFHGDKVGRLVFPIANGQGRPIAFGARTLADETPKYLNSPATSLFDKSRSLYALDLARQEAYRSKRLVVMEGYTDVIMAHQMGLEATVATLGTALTREHARELKRNADQVVLVFDGDEAGLRAADRSVDVFLLEELDLRVLVLPEKQDPCDYLLAHGAEAFAVLVDAAQEAIEFKLAVARREHDWSSVEGRRRALDHVLSALAQAGPTLPSAQQIKCEMLLDRLTRELGVEDRAVRGRLAELRRQVGTTAARDMLAPPGDEHVELGRWEPAAGTGAQRELVEILLANPAYVASIRDVVPLTFFTDRALGRIAEAAYRLADEGKSPTHDALIAVLQDGHLTEVVMACFEAGSDKGRCAERLEAVVRTIKDQRRDERAAQTARQLRQLAEEGRAEGEGDLLRKIQESLAGR